VAIFAASMALVNRDLKRIIAYSTLSQLGYMFAAAGLGAYWVALFHLAAHAFFKALLFLGAGNVMHAMDDELDIFKMGGLKKKMRWTFLYMGLASLALAGIWPFAGFFSKDTILEVAFNEHTYGIWFVLWLTAGLTAFYSFRQVFLTFLSDERYKQYGFHPHEVQKYVLWAMAPLAVLAVVFGWWKESFMEFVTQLLPAYEMSEHTHHMVWVLIAVTMAIALGGIAVAYVLYAKRLKRNEKIERSLPYRVLSNQYYIPVLYEKVFSKPYAELSDIAWKEIDLQVVDATVDGIAHVVEESGDGARKMQTGNLSDYLKWMAAGAILLAILAVFTAMKH
jgi:NADH-quinone oxidoreductase subunit L